MSVGKGVRGGVRRYVGGNEWSIVTGKGWVLRELPSVGPKQRSWAFNNCFRAVDSRSWAVVRELNRTDKSAYREHCSLEEKQVDV